MANLTGFCVTVRIADYAVVKAVIEAADAVCNAVGDAPWTLTQKIEALQEALDGMTGDSSSDSDGPEVSGNTGEYQPDPPFSDSDSDSEEWNR